LPSLFWTVLSLEHFIDAIPDGDIRLRLREVNPKNINEAETLAVRLETLKLADRQKGRMIRKVGEQAPDLNPVKINNSEDNIKHLKDNFQELKKEMSSFTKEIRDMVQNRLGNTGYIGEVKRNNTQSSNNYQPKHLFCSLAFTKSPSLLAQVSLIFIACGLLENVWLWPLARPPLVSLVHCILVTIPIEIIKINVQISLGKKFYKHNVCIAAISNEGILGMDFLAANNCDVHLSENRLCLKGESIPLFHYASNAKSCCRIFFYQFTSSYYSTFIYSTRSVIYINNPKRYFLFIQIYYSSC
jgi:hypothetical protein